MNALISASGGGSQPSGQGGGGLAPIVQVVFKEARRRKLSLAAIFTVIALIALAVGIIVPKRYQSSTTILVEESNIIAPLMEGRAVTTGVEDRAAIARDVAFSRKVMQEILTVGGWMEDKPSPVEQERLIEAITLRTTITNDKKNLIRVTYRDTDPERAYRVTKRFAEMVIQESLAAKERESRDAFNFIDSQVRRYHSTLTDAEGRLESFRSSNPDARTGVEADVNARIGELRRMIDTATLELADVESQRAEVRRQVSGENRVTAVDSRMTQLQVRLSELGAERSRLMLTYTAQHPDVVRVEHQIRDLEEELQQVQRNPQIVAGGLGSSVAAANPLYAELRSKLTDLDRRAAAANSRLSDARRMLAGELDRSRGIASSESRLSELTRDYDVNRELYQDLLRRRENARVSMQLDAERRGLSFHVQEPAEIPLRPSGLRTAHVAGLGLILALLLPIGLLFGVAKFDPRVRSAERILQQANLPVIGVIPAHSYGPRALRERKKTVAAIALVLLVPVLYAAFYIARNWTP